MEEINKVTVVDTYDTEADAMEAVNMFDDRVDALVRSGSKLNLDIEGEWVIEELSDGFKLTTSIIING